jgi:tRNA A-37 threonylcarbamoyl transferase component Bud32
MGLNDETLPPQNPFPGSSTAKGSTRGAPSPADGAEERLTTLGPYRVVEKLGSGGMGVVYKCDEPALRRFVAIKVLRGKFSNDEGYRRRFVREAQTIASLSHPAIAHVYGIGEVDERTGKLLYIVMEHVDGESIEHILERDDKVPVERALSLVRQTALGLRAAHAKGIVHRDVKPSNLLVDSQGSVKIVDFGLAKDLGNANSITDEGIVMGTPHYISPEQGRGWVVDHRSDIYSLGATFYHMVTGHPPFEGSSQVSVIVSHVNDAPPAPHEVEREIPPVISRVILRMMAKSATGRYGTYDELLEDLERLERGEVPAADASAAESKEAPPVRATSPRSRRRRILVSAAVAALAIAVGAAAWRAVIQPPRLAAEKRAAYGGWIRERDDGSILLNMDFTTPPEERAGKESWRSLLVLSGSAASDPGKPTLDGGVLRWDSFEKPFCCGLDFERVDEVQVHLGASSGSFDWGVAIVDPRGSQRRFLLFRLRPTAETLRPILAMRGHEAEPAPSLDALPPVPRRWGEGPCSAFLEFQRVGASTRIAVRIDRQRDGRHLYQAACELPGVDWASGVVVIQTMSPQKPFSASLQRLAMVGRLASPPGVEEVPWRS